MPRTSENDRRSGLGCTEATARRSTDLSKNTRNWLTVGELRRFCLRQMELAFEIERQLLSPTLTAFRRAATLLNRNPTMKEAFKILRNYARTNDGIVTRPGDTMATITPYASRIYAKVKKPPALSFSVRRQSRSP